VHKIKDDQIAILTEHNALYKKRVKELTRRLRSVQVLTPPCVWPADVMTRRDAAKGLTLRPRSAQDFVRTEEAAPASPRAQSPPASAAPPRWQGDSPGGSDASGVTPRELQQRESFAELQQVMTSSCRGITPSCHHVIVPCHHVIVPCHHAIIVPWRHAIVPCHHTIVPWHHAIMPCHHAVTSSRAAAARVLHRAPAALRPDRAARDAAATAAAAAA
jgi:hypothetical protein